MNLSEFERPLTEEEMDEIVSDYVDALNENDPMAQVPAMWASLWLAKRCIIAPRTDAYKISTRLGRFHALSSLRIILN